MNRLFLYTLLFLCVSVPQVNAQSRIKMQKEGGVYTVPCEVNGLKLRFILDTGASQVCISAIEAVFMFKNGYLDIDDIKGSSKARIADGSIIEGMEVILREIKIGNKTLNNIKATVVKSAIAPLLLGQSAIQQLGTIKLDGDELVIVTPRKKSTKKASSTSTTKKTTKKKTSSLKNTESKTTDNPSNNNDAQEWLDKGYRYYDNKEFDKAVRAYTIAYNLDNAVIDAVHYIFFAISSKEIKDFDNAIFLYECAKKELKEDKSFYVSEYGQEYWINMMSMAYISLMELYLDLNENDLVLSLGNEILLILDENSIVQGQSKIYFLFAQFYSNKKDYTKGIEMLDLTLDNFLVENYDGQSLAKLEKEGVKDETIAFILRLMSTYYRFLKNESHYMAYLKKAVVFGSIEAKEELDSLNIKNKAEPSSKKSTPKAQTNKKLKT